MKIFGRADKPDQRVASTLISGGSEGEATTPEIDVERSRLLWRDSIEYRGLRKAQIRVLLWICVVGAVLTVIAMGVYYYQYFDYRKPNYTAAVAGVGAGAIFAALYVALFVQMLQIADRRRMFIYRQSLGLAEKLEERENALATEGGSLELSALWSVTQQRIEYYHRIASSQSEQSFKNGVIASGAGFVLLVLLGVAGSFFADSIGAAITLASLGVVGAAMTAYLGGTFMKAQSEASAQLREFFNQPVEFLRILGAERLIDTLPAADRAAAVNLVVQSLMRATPDAAAASRSDK